MVNLVRHDLEFILRQIKIAEAHSFGTPLTEIHVDANGNVVAAGTPGSILAISHPLAPYGLRTVDGSYNNLIPGREEWGAADQPFVHVTTPSYRDEDDDAMPFPGYVGPDASNPGGQNNNYGDHAAGGGAIVPGTVVDADPRIISNLIVDQTLDNPAAIYAALVYAGLSGAALNTALQAIVAAKTVLDTAIAAAPGQAGTIAALQAEVDAAAAALAAAQAGATAADEALSAAEAISATEQAELAAAVQTSAAANATLIALLTDGDSSPAGQAAEAAALAALQAAQVAQAAAQAEADAADAAVTAAQNGVTAAAAVVGAAQAELTSAQADLAAAQHVEIAQAALDNLLETHGVEMEGASVVIPNVAPDEGLSAPFNSWFTLFGQFFDHGLDLVAKGGGTVYIPLQEDDPLYNPASPRTNFMVLTRTTPDAANLTTPWVDQNQTYSSHASKQLFMREYDMVGDQPVSTGKLLSGERGLATWADVKEQAAEKLGFRLTDKDVGNIPLFAMDEYGEFIRGPNGLPQVVAHVGLDGTFGTADDILVEGDLDNPVDPSAVVIPSGHGALSGTTVNAIRTGHAFLDDIAHAAAMTNSRGQALIADPDAALGITQVENPDYNASHTGQATFRLETTQFVVPNPAFNAGQPASAANPQFLPASRFYDNELLDAHYVTGDGRGNENIGLSAVHHIFHSEHNHVVDQIKQKVLASGDLAFINEWLATPVTSVPAGGAGLQWDGERLFQAARFTTEMQYQHLVFEEFARKVQPDVDAFVFNASLDVNPAIFAEFAHVVYRFGHSMLNETVDIVNADGSDGSLDLFDAFLNPLAFGSSTVDHDTAAGAIIRGMTAQVGSEIDEFVTNVLRNQLLGIPLDLAAINIARGRDTGIPSLNAARAQFREIANGDTQLDPYTSWTDFALNLKNPASIVNFIAAYGTHGTITGATTLDGKRLAATNLVFGGEGAPADRQAFLNGQGQYADDLGGLNDVDLWVGGLAEKKMAFGGMLGSTFSFIFELQMENLQNADRFYYLSRVQGLNFLNELENNSLAKMILNNTDLGESGYALPGDIFSVPDHVLYMDHAKQNRFGHEDPQQEDAFLEALSPMIERRDAAGTLINPVDNPNAIASYIRVNSNDHVLIQGTNAAETIIAGGGDDSVWGMGGNDRIEAGYGVDKIHGGDGDDIITNNGTDIGEVDMLHGEAGNDVIHGGSGLALIFGNEGQDFIITGPDGKEAFGGLDDDFILGGEGGDFLLGNEGDDWIEGGGGFDVISGDNSELFFNSTIIGHDVMFAGADEQDFDAESGDDIMVQGESVMRNEGMLGFDWAINKGNSQNAESDLLVPIFTTDQQDILRDRFDAVEALSGWDKDDTLRGDDRADPDQGDGDGGAGLAGAENTMVGHQLTQAGVDRIDGLRELLGSLVAAAPAGVDPETVVAFDDGNILLGGGGSDVIEGRGGDDFIDGDAWLNVRIAIRDQNGLEVATAEGLSKVVTVNEELRNTPPYADWHDKPLHNLMVSGAINPIQLKIVREIVVDDGAGDTDVAVFNDALFAADGTQNYTITQNADGSVTVAHVNVTTAVDPDTGRQIVSDGVDTLRNIEKLQFTDRVVDLTAPELQLNGYDVVVRSWADNFNTSTLNANTGTAAFNGAWAETLDDGTAGGGQIQIDTGGTNTLRFLAGNQNGASITRGLDLSNARSASVSFSITDANVGNGDDEVVEFQFAADGVNFVTLQTFNGNNNGTQSIALPFDVPFENDAAIRFRMVNSLDNGESFSIDNLQINADIQNPAAAPSVDVTSTFTEGNATIPIASDSRIVEDSQLIRSARITLTNAFDGDELIVPAALTAADAPVRATTQAVGASIVVTLTGDGTLNQYQAALQTIGFRNTSQNPDPTQRVIEVTVNDGFLDSNVARSFVNVVPVNDAPTAVDDNVVTNITGAFVVRQWMMLRNDSDIDGNPLSVTGATENDTGFSIAFNAGDVTAQRTNTANHDFTYTVSDGALTDTADVDITWDTAGTLSGSNGNDIILGDGASSTIDGNAGNDLIIAGAGNDTIDGDTGDDEIHWSTGDGRDAVNGGAGTDTFVVNGDASGETFRIYTRAAAVTAGMTGLAAATEIVITRNGTNNASIVAELDNIEEIIVNGLDVSANDGNGAPNGGVSGGDTIQVIGNFNGTSLNFSTITINGEPGNDTVDISSLQSAHRIVFRSNGGNDTIVGALRPQDVIELAQGTSLADYVSTANPNGTTTLSNGTHSITFASSGTPVIRDEEDMPRGAFEISLRDLEGLKKLINGQLPFDDDDDAEHALGVRTISGAGNNEDNPSLGVSDTPFIRLTEARYGDYDASINNRALNPIFEGLDPRSISNLLGAQEAGLPKASNEANIFFMAFGQYFDHGLDFLPKSAINGTVQIGAPGIGAPGQGNPADLTRGEVHAIGADGVPQHLNKTTAFVDQNQAYGSHALVTQFLREGDGNGGLTAHLLKGAADPSNPDFSLLPTLREAIQHHWANNTLFLDPSLPGGQVRFRDYYSNYPVSETVTGDLIDAEGGFDPQVLSKLANNFMGSGQSLLLDSNPFISALDHYVAGDGRVNENFALTSMHTIWARNHDFHVEQLREAGFDGTEQELFEAAKVINEAEYQRVVFTEFADMLLGGMRGVGDHGHGGYNPDADPGVSHEFAAAVFRVGHSLIGQTLTVIDANGQPKQVPLFDAFLNPSNDPDVFTAPLSQLAQYGYVPQPGYEQYGVNSILKGIAGQAAEQVDFNIVDAVRNDLVRIQADLFSFNVARGRDVGLGTLNQVRADLAASQNPYIAEAVSHAGDMSPYSSWEDFQTRNGLSDSVIAQFKQAYPDLVLDTPEKLAAFTAANPDITLVNGNTVKGIDRVDLWVGGLAETHINGGVVGQTFWIVLHEQFDRLQEADRFYYKDRLEAFDFYDDFIDGQEFSDIVARVTGLDDLDEQIFEVNDEDDGEDENDEDDDDDDASNGDDDDDDEDSGDDDDTDNDDDDEDDDDDSGDDDDDTDDTDDDDEDDEDDDDANGDDDDDSDDDCGCDDDDTVNPPPAPPAGGNLRTGTAQTDVLIGTAGADSIVGLGGDDVLIGEAGEDTVSGGEGNDFADAGAGADTVFLGTGDDHGFGGDGDDALYGDAGNDRVFGGAGNDRLDGGTGNDTVVGGTGNDLFRAAAGDGDDVYHGDDLGGGNGVDTLDMSSITASITVDLGAGLLGRGSAVSAQSGHDTLWNIENVATGSGNDTITASTAVNVMEGGAGADVFRFTSAQAADGDTILDFEPGDRLDLATIDADTGAAGNQSFTLASGSAFTASAQLLVTWETRADGDYTIIAGNTNGDTEADFLIELKGTHALNPGNTAL